MNFAKFSNYLNTFYAEKNIPGVGLKMYYQNKPVYEHYAGYADVENKIPFGQDTLFNLYSATKVVTCTAAMQLIESDKLRLDAPLHEYIPEYKRAENPITIEHLFTMTGGIGGRHNKNIRPASTLDVIKAVSAEPLLFEPGTHFKYGYCHDVLGGVIEVVSGKKLGIYMKENIFDKLGMADTSFKISPEKQDRMAVHYIGFDGITGKSRDIGEIFEVHAWDEYSYESGGGGLISSVTDYAKFANALCNYQILSKQSVELMRTNRLQGTQLNDFSEFGGWSKAGYGYGLGVRTLINRERNNSLSENGEFGWDGACGCYVVIDPVAQVAIFYAQQEAGSPWWEWHGMVRNLAYATLGCL